MGMTVPDAEVIMYQGVSGWRGKYKLDELAKTVEGYTADRLVLGLVGDEGSSFSKDWYQAWAKSGSSSWGTMKIDLSTYVPLPMIERKNEVEELKENLQLCKTYLDRIVRNGTCFNKCHAPNLMKKGES